MISRSVRPNLPLYSGYMSRIFRHFVYFTPFRSSHFFALREFFAAHAYLRMTSTEEKDTGIKTSLLFLHSSTVLSTLSACARVADEYDGGKIFQAKFHFAFFFVGFAFYCSFLLPSERVRRDITTYTSQGARVQARRVNKGASTNSTYVIAMRGSLFHRFYDYLTSLLHPPAKLSEQDA